LAPLLFQADGIQLVISPLNILGDQNVQELKEMNIEAIAITSETATFQNFQVSNSMSLLKSNLTSCRVQDIEDGKYRAIITNVETLMQQESDQCSPQGLKNRLAGKLSLSLRFRP
jgi:ATP-dependent DNA helicase RecQ